MLEHATLASAATGLIGIGIGTIAGAAWRSSKIGPLRDTLAARDLAAWRSSKIGPLRDTLAARDLTIEAKDTRIVSLNKEATELGNRCSELRVANGKMAAVIDQLKPLAEKHMNSRANLSKGSAASAAKRKATNGSAPLAASARKNPPRNSAHA